MLCKTHVGALRVAADIVLDLITSHVTAGGPNSEARPEAAHALFARLPALAHHVSPDGIILCATDGWLDAFGYARSEVDGHRLAEFLTRDAAAALLTSPPFSIAAGPLDFVTAQGAVRALLVESRAAGDGPDAGTLLVCRPAAGRLDAAVSIDDQLASALSDERQLRMTLLDHMSDAMVRTDAQGRVIALNAAAERFLQVDSTRARHRTLADILPVRDPVDGEPMDILSRDQRPWLSNGLPIQFKDRRAYADVRHVAVNSVNGTPEGHLILLSDLSETRKLHDAICFQAEHDKLTGLYNRHEFSRRLKRLIEQNHAEDERHVLCHIDINQFRLINDTCGHTAGDELLKQFGELLSHGIRGDDTLARIGNDQYTLLLRGCTTFHAQRRTRALLDRLEAFRFQWEAKRFRVTVSIGLVAIDAHTKDAESALRAAEIACHNARACGRNRFAVFDANDDGYNSHVGDLKWMRRVESALEEDRFVLFAQPIRALDPEEDIADHHEILVRMLDRDGHLIEPGAFLPAVERFNLSAALDRWVVRRSLKLIADIERTSPKSRFWTINLSGQSLSDRLFQDYLLSELRRSQLSPDKVCFEITETAAIAQMDVAIDFMNVLRNQGCLIALDDFGSGLSSFAYLKNLPVDLVKIDGQFVRDIGHSSVAAAMVRSIHEIARLMGKKTVAEYVENDATLQSLRGIGVDFVQGYGIGMPRPLSELLES